MQHRTNIYSIARAKQALWLLVPAASIGVTMATYISPGIIGQSFFTLIKIWLVAVPVFWRLTIEKKSLKLPKITKQQINFGLVLGLVMFAVIIVAYWSIARQLLDITAVKDRALAVGITQVSIYFLGTIYWSFINSFIEECVWRGFVYRQCKLFLPRLLAIMISALFFTLHHIIALSYYLQNPLLVIIGSFGVFIAGVIWSACYQKSGFWACYLSHILADLAIAFVGWHLLFT